MFTGILGSTAILFMLAAGAQAQTISADLKPREVVVGSYKVAIEERDGKCDLIYEGRHNGKITLDIPSPCEFLREDNGKAQRHRYRNRRKGGFFDVILVLGGPLDKSKSDALMKDGCATRIQPVSLSSRGVVAGSVGTGIIVCPLDHLDEKFFASMAKPI